MNFHLIGVNHLSAPLALRERLVVSEEQLPQAVQTLVKQPGVEEGMVLSTCNRVEVLTCTRQGADLRGFLVQRPGAVIDAIFGTGLNSPVGGHIQSVIADVNASNIPVVSIDLPSGLSADSCEPIGDSIFAVAAEEFGFVGSVFLLFLYVALGLLGLRIASRAPASNSVPTSST